jgi:uncharacterized protein
MFEAVAGQIALTGDRTNRAAYVAIIAGVVLLAVFYLWGRPNGYYASGASDLVGRLSSGSPTDFVGSGAYMWWGLTSLVLRVAIPVGLMWWIAGLRPRELGLQVSQLSGHAWLYVGMFVVMVPVLLWASGLQSFQSYYPLYDRAADGGLALGIYLLGYSLQFVGVEVFFRGFLTFGLFGQFGMWAIVIATIPYVLIHFGKPTPEIIGAVFAGLILSYLALKTQSVVPGIGLHIAVALTMDFLVITRV